LTDLAVLPDQHLQRRPNLDHSSQFADGRKLLVDQHRFTPGEPERRHDGAIAVSLGLSHPLAQMRVQNCKIVENGFLVPRNEKSPPSGGLSIGAPCA
jgi:hypothetical protein